jgi:alkyl sulfatase BDS1-like metallo-beta-lactamase superfamily hydrolase
MHKLYHPRRGDPRRPVVVAPISDAIERYGEKTEIEIAQHHWPMWGNERIVLPEEAARPLQVHSRPERAAAQSWPDADGNLRATEVAAGARERRASRGYYGTLSYNAKAVYQFISAGTTPTRRP